MIADERSTRCATRRLTSRHRTSRTARPGRLPYSQPGGAHVARGRTRHTSSSAHSGSVVQTVVASIPAEPTAGISTTEVTAAVEAASAASHLTTTTHLTATEMAATSTATKVASTPTSAEATAVTPASTTSVTTATAVTTSTSVAAATTAPTGKCGHWHTH